MNPVVQAAIDAVNQGDKPKAVELARQALIVNPNDVDVWLVLAAVLDDPEKKRQCLNRVLKLDPTNKLAREELLDMDRAAMGTAPAQPEVRSVSTETSQPRPPLHSSSAYSYEAAPAPERTELPAQPANPPSVPQSKPTSGIVTEKPLVFKYSIVSRIILYALLAVVGCVTLIAFQSSGWAGIIPGGFFLVVFAGIWTVSSRVEVSEKGIRTTHLFELGTKQVDWDGIAHIQSNARQQNLQLTTRNGETIKVTSQVNGYPAIVEMLRRKRPDLFGAAASGTSYASGYSSSPSVSHGGSSYSTPSFTGTKTFRKSLFRQYWPLLVVIPCFFFAAWVAIDQPENRVGALIATAILGIMIVLPLFQVSSVKVEPDKLTIETLFEEKVVSADEVKEVKMGSIRGRYGRVTHYVEIVLANGKRYPVQGFSEGDEIIYGILSNWWNSSRGR